MIHDEAVLEQPSSCVFFDEFSVVAEDESAKLDSDELVCDGASSPMTKFSIGGADGTTTSGVLTRIFRVSLECLVWKHAISSQ